MTNDIVALENFNRVFHLRYQGTGPFLFIGSLDAAVQASLFAPLFDVMPLSTIAFISSLQLIHSIFLQETSISHLFA